MSLVGRNLIFISVKKITAHAPADVDAVVTVPPGPEKQQQENNDDISGQD